MSYAVIVLNKYGSVSRAVETSTLKDAENIFLFLADICSRDEAIFIYAPNGKLVKTRG
jgi:hypothetical protein